MDRDIYIGLDIGGTKVLAGCANKEGEIFRKVKVKTPLHLEQGLELVNELTHELSDGYNLKGIGVAIGGPINLDNGTVSPLHQPEWRNVALKKLLEEQWKCPCHFEVDTNVAALGEYYLGNYTASKFLYITLSTGMGGGILIDGKIYQGLNGFHPEIAHQSINYRCSFPKRIQCECGVDDCLEALVSGNAIQRIYGKPAEKLTEKEWDEVAWNLGQGIRNIVTIMAPEVIVFGGGIATHGGENFIKKVEAYAAQKLKLVPMPTLRISLLGYDTALSGACYIAVHGTHQP